MNADPNLRRVISYCAEVLERAELTPELRRLLARVVPFEMACWGLLDPGTLWPVTNESTSTQADAALRAWQYELTVDDVNQIAELARGPAHVGVLSVATDQHPDRSARFRMVLGPIGVCDELRAVLSLDGVCWGWLALFRFSTGAFTVREAEQVAVLVPHLARAWRAALLSAHGGLVTPDTAPAVLILDKADAVESMTPAGQELLDQLPRGRAGPTADVLSALALSVRVAADRPGDSAAHGALRSRTMLPGSDGSWLLLEAAPLIGQDSRVAVTIRRAGRSDVAELLLRAYGLTNRETQVALAVLRNETNRQIATTLLLSPWTVQDHLKAIFAKTGVRSRRELGIKLFRPPTSLPVDQTAAR